MMRIQMADNLSFSRVVLGFWRVDEWNLTTDQLITFLEECLDMGITTMDHADIYGNYTFEEIFGGALEKRPDLRKKMELVTKSTIVYASANVRVKYYDNSEKYIVSQLEKSLKNMRTDYVDTLLLHRPNPFMNPEEVASAFDKLFKDGKVRTFGVSNYLPHEYRMLKSYLRVPMVTNQIELSCLRMENMENGVIHMCMEERIHPMIWSPLAGGKIFTAQGEAEERLRSTLETIRAEIGADNIDIVAFSWLLSHPAGLVPITGSGEIKLVKRPVEALRYALTPEQWFMIWTAVKGHKVL
ncbi:MAG: aldo/keto reductase [Treponema sp.]|jgi:predicted oxidoreductase|nr:aldo/keto reductase [Treponema sp.]